MWMVIVQYSHNTSRPVRVASSRPGTDACGRSHGCTAPRQDSISADYDINDDLTHDLLQINKGAIKLGPTPVFVSGTVDSKPMPTQVDINLKAHDISITEAAHLAAADGMAFSPEPR